MGGIIGLFLLAIVRCYDFFIVNELPINAISEYRLLRPFFVKSTLKGSRFTASIDGNQYLFMFNDQLDAQAGALLDLDLEFQPCSPPTNPGVFNYCRWLRAKGVSGVYRVMLIV